MIILVSSFFIIAYVLIRLLGMDKYLLPLIAIIISLLINFYKSNNLQCSCSDIIIDARYATTFVEDKNIFSQCDMSSNIISLIIAIFFEIFLIVILVAIVNYEKTIVEYVRTESGPSLKEKIYFENNKINYVFTAICKTNLKIDTDHVFKNISVDNQILKISKKKYARVLQFVINIGTHKNKNCKIGSSGVIIITGCKGMDDVNLVLEILIDNLLHLNVKTIDGEHVQIKLFNKIIMANSKLPIEIDFENFEKNAIENKNTILNKYGIVVCTRSSKYEPFGLLIKLKYDKISICLFRTGKFCINCNSYIELVDAHSKIVSLCKNYEGEIQKNHVNAELIEKAMYDFLNE